MNAARLTVIHMLTPADKECVLIAAGLQPGHSAVVASGGPAEFWAALQQRDKEFDATVWKPYPACYRLLHVEQSSRWRSARVAFALLLAFVATALALLLVVRWQTDAPITEFRSQYAAVTVYNSTMMHYESDAFSCDDLTAKSHAILKFVGDIGATDRKLCNDTLCTAVCDPVRLYSPTEDGADLALVQFTGMRYAFRRMCKYTYTLRTGGIGFYYFAAICIERARLS